MQPRKALGRGLDALIPTTEETPESTILAPTFTHPANSPERIKTVPINQISPNRLQQRKIFNDEKIKELAASIKEQGVIQPLIVTQVTPNKYELIAGERRLRASRLAGLTEVPVVIKSVDAEGMLELSLIENIQREDLNAIEEANAIQELINQFNYTQDEAATRLGKSRVAITNSLRLLNLPKIIQDDVSTGKLSAGHARALLAVTGLQDQLKLRERILNANLTVRDIERMIQSIKGGVQKTAKLRISLTPQLKHIEEEITKKLATKTIIEPDKNKKGGRLVIEYYSPQDLDRIYNVIAN